MRRTHAADTTAHIGLPVCDLRGISHSTMPKIRSPLLCRPVQSGAGQFGSIVSPGEQCCRSSESECFVAELNFVGNIVPGSGDIAMVFALQHRVRVVLSMIVELCVETTYRFCL